MSLIAYKIRHIKSTVIFVTFLNFYQLKLFLKIVIRYEMINGIISKSLIYFGSSLNPAEIKSRVAPIINKDQPHYGILIICKKTIITIIKNNRT